MGAWACQRSCGHAQIEGAGRRQLVITPAALLTVADLGGPRKVCLDASSHVCNDGHLLPPSTHHTPAHRTRTRPHDSKEARARMFEPCTHEEDGDQHTS